MAKAEKKATERNKLVKYDEKLTVKGSIMDIMNAAMMQAKRKELERKVDLENKVDAANARKKP